MSTATTDAEPPVASGPPVPSTGGAVGRVKRAEPSRSSRNRRKQQAALKRRQQRRRIGCLACGAPNPSQVERCRICNAPLDPTAYVFAQARPVVTVRTTSKTRVGWTLVILLLMTAAGGLIVWDRWYNQRATAWRAYRGPNEIFVASLPGEPDVFEYNRELAGGRIGVRLWSTNTDAGRVDIALAALPLKATDFDTPAELEQVLGLRIAPVSGAVSDVRRTESRWGPAVEARLDEDGQQALLRLVPTVNGLFVLSVAGNPPDQAAFDRLVSSFDLPGT